MLKNSLLIFFLFFLGGCGTFYDGMMTQCHYVVVSGTDENGTSKMVHKDGWKFAEGEVKNNEKVGWWSYYRKNGTLFSKEFYKDGKWDGYIVVYYENGQIAWKGISDLAKSTSNAKAEYFAPDGTPISETEYSEKYYKLPGKWVHDLYEAQMMRLF